MHQPIAEHRPFGVVLIAILLALNGILSIIAGIAALGFVAGAGIVEIIFGLVLLYVAYGMWSLQSWAWLSTLILEGINALFAVISLIAAPASIGAWISLIIAAIIIYYLTRPEVHEAFHGRPVGL